MTKSVGKNGMNASYSIGDLADATGIAPDTIRAWERRYSKPQPIRLPSGHRRYTDDHVQWLRRVTEAMALGHRAGKVVRADEEELSAMLELPTSRSTDPKRLANLLDLVRDYRRDELLARLMPDPPVASSAQQLEESVVPLLIAVGRAWSEGKFEVRHEHFVSEVIEDLVRSMRMRVRIPASRGTVLLATLPGESHGLGVQMASLLCAEAGMTPRILGTAIPVEEIARAAVENQVDAVAISVSLATGGVETDRLLGRLRRLVSPSIPLVVGGRGARGVRRGPRGIEYVKSLPDFARWLAER